MLRTLTIDALSHAALTGADPGAMQQDRISMILHGAGGLAVLKCDLQRPDNKFGTLTWQLIADIAVSTANLNAVSVPSVEDL